MKKFAKMSLVAAIAVAGMTSASAASLEEAIKGVDVSGKVRYRMEEISSGVEDQDVNIDVKIKVPVNDNVTFIANINADNDNEDGEYNSLGSSFTNSDDELDGKNINLGQYYFQYVNGAVTVNLGTQPIPGRQTDGLNGSGVVALYNAGAFTIGAGSMYNTEATSEMLNSVIAMGSVGPVSLLGQYTDVDETLSAYNLKADASFGPVKVGVEYSEKELDDNSSDDLSILKAYISGKVAGLSAKVMYATTGDDGSGSIDNEAETPAEYLLWQTASKNKAEFDVWSIDASYAVTDKVSLRAAYADSEWVDGGDEEATEILGQISYKMSKNLNTYLRVSEFDQDGSEEVTRGRIEVKYSF